MEPTLAPKSSQSELAKVKIPVFTKPIAKSVVAVDDCNAVVARKPEINHFTFVFVYFSRNFTSAGPDALLSPSVMSDIQSRKSPMPPKSIPKENSSISF